MKRQDKAWDARLRTQARGSTIRHRNRAAVVGLTLLTVVLAMTSLLADLWLAPGLPALGCYGAATVSGIILLAFLFSKRLWVTRPPGR